MVTFPNWLYEAYFLHIQNMVDYFYNSTDNIEDASLKLTMVDMLNLKRYIILTFGGILKYRNCDYHLLSSSWKDLYMKFDDFHKTMQNALKVKTTKSKLVVLEYTKTYLQSFMNILKKLDRLSQH